MHAFDGQTDRRTDGQTDRNLIVKTALHSMQSGKNPESVAEHRSLLIPISSNKNCLFVSISLKYLPVIY